MNSTAKVLVPDQEWIIQDNQKKIGSISKSKFGYVVMQNGKSVGFENLSEIKAKFGIAIFEESINKVRRDTSVDKPYLIYEFPCRTQPYNPVYSVKNRLPLYSKNPKSKSQYCAGYYAIQFGKGWGKAFCPKLITIQRYPYHGPFKTMNEVKTLLHTLNKA